MKKITSFAMCICLLLTLASCTPDGMAETSTAGTTLPTTSVPTTESSAEETTEYVDPSVTYQVPMTAVSVPVTMQSFTDNGVELFTYTYQNISLTLPDANVADAVIVDFLNQVDFSNSAGGDLLTAAKADYPNAESWTPYSFSVLYHPKRLDQNILSFFGTEQTYTKTMGYSGTNVSLTYDLQTGAHLELRDILATDYSAEDLVSLIVASLDEINTDNTLFSDYSYIVSDLFATNTLPESWYFSETGLSFYFAPYEIAPYSRGTVVVDIPYDKLGGLMKGAYFPAEQVNFQGEIILSEFSENALESYTQFTEIILDEAGDMFLLSADGTLLNVRIETGNWSADGITFTPDATVFASAALSSGDAVMIQVSQDMLADLRLTYTSDGETISHPLEQNK